jgi:hypothetical protein
VDIIVRSRHMCTIDPYNVDITALLNHRCSYEDNVKCMVW